MLKPTEPAKNQECRDHCMEGNAWRDPLLDLLQERICGVELETIAGTVAWRQAARPWRWVARLPPIATTDPELKR
ncbi:hypothetical protein NDU88_007460 [Pleurodeles waltl]|uniref:Uncharacterized protein n=1 Tax=Pleurodeles waltl TaxID=8319 RepID=A0AAV7NWA7_PLEWA|nr:hypothetical protein NDU88_007460 [Pleurodeles waltl]